MKDELQEKRNAHRQAQEARRALEKEQSELKGRIEYAVSGADVGELQRLNKRKRSIPEELQLASQVEHAAYGQYVKGEQQNEGRLKREAEQEHKAAMDQLIKRDKEWNVERNALSAAVDKAQRAVNVHEREIEAWSTRFTVADTRYRQAVSEQEAA